jgi:hypothetical protein
MTTQLKTMHTLDELLRMNYRQLFDLFSKAHPIAAGALDNSQYLGIDLSLPPWMNKLLWKTFGKTFYRDPETGVLRGWNIRMQQTGWDGPGRPMENNGRPVTFGHYHFLPAQGKKFPKGWQGPHYLDYSVAGNAPFDPARFTYSPLVAVNAGSVELLLGWEVFKVGPAVFSIPDFWALKREGPLQHIVPAPRRG